MGPVGTTWNLVSPLPHETWTARRELLALRAWRLVRWADDGEVRLASLWRDVAWHGPVFRADFRPEPTCGSGVYAIKPVKRPRHGQEFDWIAGRDAWIWGWVALSGQVVEHEFGYRAESAVIRQLRLGVRAHLCFPAANDKALLLRSLEQRYQCRVKAGYYEPRKACRMIGDLKAEGAQPPALEWLSYKDVVPAVAPLPYHVPMVVPAAPRPAPTPRPPKGTSAHGLKFTAVIRAFQRAEAELGTKWQITGRGHCRRCTVDGRYSRRLKGQVKCWELYRGYGRYHPAILFPIAIVQRAARILRVGIKVLMGREYR